MEYRRLGNSGLKVSVLSLGSWISFQTQIDTNLAKDMLKTAYDAGVNFFDNAEVYAAGQSEIMMGQALKELNFDRDSYIVSSKAFFGRIPFSRDKTAAHTTKPTQQGLSRKHLVEACHQALERLQVEYLDLFYCHRPDPDTPISEIVFTMNILINQGKILYWGTSEWSATQIMEAYDFAEIHKLIPPTMEQPQYNLFHRQRVEIEYMPLYKKGLGTTIWSPLASGILTGKYNNFLTKGELETGSRFTLPELQGLRESILESEEGYNNIKKAGKLQAIADTLHISLTHLSLAWCIHNPHVSSVILGASKISQLKDNLRALDAISFITDSIINEIDTITA